MSKDKGAYLFYCVGSMYDVVNDGLKLNAKYHIA